MQDGRHQHLEKLVFEPEHLQSDINTLFSTKSTMTIPILTVFVRLNITLTLLSRWLPYTGVNRINKTGCSIQNEPEQLESSITCSQHFFKRTRLNIS